MTSGQIQSAKHSCIPTWKDQFMPKTWSNLLCPACFPLSLATLDSRCGEILPSHSPNEQNAFFYILLRHLLIFVVFCILAEILQFYECCLGQPVMLSAMQEQLGQKRLLGFFFLICLGLFFFLFVLLIIFSVSYLTELSYQVHQTWIYERPLNCRGLHDFRRRIFVQ